MIHNIMKVDYIIFKTTKFEKLLARLLPYHLPFINKRTRVKIRSYYRYAGGRKASKCLCKLLSKSQVNTNFTKPVFVEDEWVWEVKFPGHINKNIKYDRRRS